MPSLIEESNGPICVLGMHRSGTSCLAGSLESSGVDLGEVVNKSRNNLKGNKESKVLRRINEDVLAHSGGSWDALPKEVSWTRELEDRRDAHIAGFSDVSLWGFKDPRCLATLPFWRDSLDDMRFVATFRHPALVAHSLSNRPGLEPKTAPVQLWIDYNQRLLRLCETETVHLVCFDWSEKEYLAGLERLNSVLGLDPPRDKGQFFASDLRKTGLAWPETPPEIKDEAEQLYQSLLSHTLIKAGPIRVSKPSPRLSIVVVFHNMAREARRTLFALSDKFQTDVDADQYEVIAVENGTQSLDPDWVRGHGPNFRYHFHETVSSSPAGAINAGATLAKGGYVALLVDGARMPSPGVVGATLSAIRAFPPCFVSALAWHLGPDIQRISRKSGYDQAREDEMLDSVDWKTNGYRLFDVATQAPSSRCGLLNGLPNECSWLALPKARFDRLAGYDEGFQSPGGGYVNHDFLQRLCALKNLKPVQLIGEGTFHQIHDGAATGAPNIPDVLSGFKAEFRRLRGREFKHVELPEPHYIGQMPPQARRFILRSAS